MMLGYLFGGRAHPPLGPGNLTLTHPLANIPPSWSRTWMHRSSREGTWWMPSDSEVLGGHLSGPGKALLSILALTQNTVRPGGREREKEKHRVYLCHLLSQASHASPLIYSP